MFAQWTRFSLSDHCLCEKAAGVAIAGKSDALYHSRFPSNTLRF